MSGARKTGDKALKLGFGEALGKAIFGAAMEQGQKKAEREVQKT